LTPEGNFAQHSLFLSANSCCCLSLELYATFRACVASLRAGIHNAPMHSQRWLLLIPFSLFVLLTALGGDAAEKAIELPAQQSCAEPQAAELGFQNLLGKGFAGWEAAEGDPAACWKREGDELICTGAKGPWLRYSKPVKDFNLRLEFLLKEGGNSGVYVRVPPDGVHHGVNSGIEVQILDDASPRYKNLRPYQYSGSLYAIVPADQRVARPAGTWNTLEIDCKGDRYLVRQNGVEVVKSSRKIAPELTERRIEGYLGLQNHSEEVRFRNIRLGNSQQ
jgi:hypothetical protein